MRKATVVLPVLMLCLVASPLTAAPTRVQIEDNDFRPHIVGVSVGDAVRWTRASDSFGTHNVLGERKLIYSGPPTDGNITIGRACPQAPSSTSARSTEQQ